MNERAVAHTFLISLAVFLALGMAGSLACAQEIAGELVFEDPFEEDSGITGWYVVGGGSATDYGPVGDGFEGGTAQVIVVDDPGDGLNDVQFSYEFPAPEGADQYPWRITCYIWVDIAPFMIRPIIAMSEDPWTGTYVELEIPQDQAQKWFFLDVTVDPGDFLTTPNVIVIFHMGANDAVEVRFDNLKVYLLNKEADVDYWMVY
jgi:hypothetical protein